MKPNPISEQPPIHLSKINTTLPARHLSWLERVMVQHAHPTKLILDTIAYAWGIYFFARHELLLGLAALFGVGILGTLLSQKADKNALAQTPLGKFFLVSTHPINMTFQMVGYILVLYGSWVHSASIILSGVSAVLLGHLWGWKRIQPNYGRSSV